MRGRIAFFVVLVFLGSQTVRGVPTPVGRAISQADVASHVPSEGPDDVLSPDARKSLQDSSLLFVPNRGQQPDQVAFTALGANPSMFFTLRGITYSLFEHVKPDHRDAAKWHPKDVAEHAPRKGWAVRQDFVGAHASTPIGTGPTPGKVNYLIGPISAHVTNLPLYSGLTYDGLWDGIDLHYRGEDGSLKYEFHVRPGADPSQVRLAYRGAKNVMLTPGGELRIKTPIGSFTDAAPVAWQDVAGRQVPVQVAYLPAPADAGNDFVYGFAVGAYNTALPLVIDPAVVVYSTYLGGSEGPADDPGRGIAVDAAGAAYVTGGTRSSDFPTTVGAFDTAANGDFDAFVTKLAPSGAGLIYSTYLGGSGFDAGAGIAVDAAGAAYVTGKSSSVDFPTTLGTFDTSLGGGADAFVSKLAPSGAALTYSTYLGGSSADEFGEIGFGVAVDAEAAAYVTGRTDSTDFPTTVGAFDIAANGDRDAFVSKVAPSGAALAYSTYLGGIGRDSGSGVAVDAAGAAYVGGWTSTVDFPTTTGAFATNHGGGVADAFVTKLAPSGGTLTYSTYLGGSEEDSCSGIIVDAAGAAYVTGSTDSADFPTTLGAFDTTLNGGVDAFVTKIGSAGEAQTYSTYLGGSGFDSGRSIDVDGTGAAFITGYTEFADFPASLGAVGTTASGPSAFLAKLVPSGAAFSHSTYLGGSGYDAGNAVAVDGAGAAYVTGETDSDDYPTTPGAFDSSLGGFDDAFVSKLGPELEVDTQAPSLILTRPEAGHLYLDAAGIDVPMPFLTQAIIATPTSPFELRASATDNIGVAAVRFFVDGAMICADATAPYACDWSPGSALSATVRAEAEDTSGNLSPPDEVEVLLGV